MAISHRSGALVSFFAILAAAPGVTAAEQPSRHKHHDIYEDLYDNGLYRDEGGQGLLCCGGDPEAGDCEPVWSNFSILPSGDALFDSQRYRATVLVARDKIMWMTIRGGEFSVAHWCGMPRTALVFPGRPLEPPSALNPDPVFWTFCATITPGT